MRPHLRMWRPTPLRTYPLHPAGFFKASIGFPSTPFEFLQISINIPRNYQESLLIRGNLLGRKWREKCSKLPKTSKTTETRHLPIVSYSCPFWHQHDLPSKGSFCAPMNNPRTVQNSATCCKLVQKWCQIVLAWCPDAPNSCQHEASHNNRKTPSPKDAPPVDIGVPKPL